MHSCEGIEYFASSPYQENDPVSRPVYWYVHFKVFLEWVGSRHLDELGHKLYLLSSSYVLPNLSREVF